MISELQIDFLNRSLKAITLAADALLQLCITTIHPALEMLVQRLSHLHGLSKWPYHFAALGLQVWIEALPPNPPMSARR